MYQDKGKAVRPLTVHSSFQYILPYLPPELQQPLMKLQEPDTVQEIRLRNGRSMQIIRQGQAYTVTRAGSLTAPEQNGIPVTGQVLDTVFRNLCAQSVHSFQDAIRQGYLPLAGGNRAGLCGTAVLRGGVTESVRDISSINLRIASERTGCAEALASEIGDPRQSGGILIAGPPASGKTTVLRDLARIFGGRMRVCIPDERGELAAVRNGVPQFQVGAQTDVFDGYPKAEAIAAAIRVMSPELLICDELGGEHETDSLLSSVHSGVTLIVSAHAADLRTLQLRPQIRRLIDAGMFRLGFLLGTGERCGQVTGKTVFGRDNE